MTDDLDDVLQRAEEVLAALRGTLIRRKRALRSALELAARHDAERQVAQQAVDLEVRLRPGLERQEQAARVAFERWKRERWERLGDD